MAITPKSEDKYVEMCSTAQSFIFPKWHSFKIGTLDSVLILFVFKSFLGLAYTFRIVKDNYFTKTMADRRLPSTDSVLTLLKWLERHMADRY